jgi:hypothetical protein
MKNQTPAQFSIFDAELGLEENLKAEGVSPRLFDGVTDRKTRAAHARIGIVMHKLRDKRIAGGKTYGELYAALYGEAL